MLHRREFSSYISSWLFKLSVCLFKPFWSCLSGLISVCLSTSLERRKPFRLFIKRSLLISPLLVLSLFLSPLAAVGFILRCVLYHFKNPYQLSVQHNSCNDQNQKKLCQYGISTMNVCLLPEFLSRFNNLSHTSKRASEIGQRIVLDQFFFQKTNDVNHNEDSSQNKTTNTLKTGIITHFPNLEFLCIQEVWQSNYSQIMKKELHKVYPYILCDVGVYNRHSNFFLLNSGLMFASKYEILDASFEYFKTSCGQCLFAGKGLLMVKVLLWCENFREDKNVVGYIFMAQLQSYQGKNKINKKQLDEILIWTKSFQERTKESNDIVAFDILTGDLNFDNLSPGDTDCNTHELFSIYKDEARKKAGMDQDWAIGTEMRQLFLHDDDISTPKGLKSCLESPALRQQYIVDADIHNACLDSLVKSLPKTEVSPVGGKRRIDYVLHNINVPIIPVQYNFVSRLATLTDHIPVSMNFRLPEWN